MIRWLLVPTVLFALGGCGDGATEQAAPATVNKAAAAPVPAPLGDTVRVRLETALGAITLELDHAHAPITTANFVRYVDEHRFDGAVFYRARGRWARRGAASFKAGSGATIAGCCPQSRTSRPVRPGCVMSRERSRWR